MPDSTLDVTERADPAKLRHLIFAEIPKTGSTSFAHMFRNVSASNGWNWVTLVRDQVNGVVHHDLY